LPHLELLEDGSVLSSGDVTKRDVFTLAFPLTDAVLPVSAVRLEVLADERLPGGGPGRAYYEGRKGDFFLSELTATAGGNPVPFVRPSHTYGKIAVGSGHADAASVLDGDGSTGWSTAEREGESHYLVLNLKEPITAACELQIELLFERHFAASLGRFRFSAASSDSPVVAGEIAPEIEAILVSPLQQWSALDLERVKDCYLRMAPALAEARAPIDALRDELPDFPTTLVMKEMPTENRRLTHLHHRGEYLSPREEVSPGLPAVFAENSGAEPTDRLTLARWLVSNDNPLVGRVTVNRAWQSFFGAGLVRSSGDFGLQSDPPTHPELLDWLACELVDSKWSIKRLHRLIVGSSTYRQQSAVSSALLEVDPRNELLARGPRFRLGAETVRDVMLWASGLWSPKMYGRGVFPPQPPSVTELAYGNIEWTSSEGEDRFRRSLYTFKKRTAPFAAFAVFDAPTGENCVVQRDRSDTPLQALTLLNDEMYLEFARAIALRAATNIHGDQEIAATIFRRLLTRPPNPAEIAAILQYQQTQLQRLSEGDLIAAEVAAGECVTNQQAAWIMVARALMNLDESVTKQ
jgi:hypothetical protein